MTSTAPAPATPTSTAPAAVRGTRPRPGRRAVLHVATGLAALLPTVWGIGVTVELATGTQRDHLFHQLTGQGLLLSALWLTPVVHLSRAGLRGRRPSTAVGLHHLSLVAAGLVAGVAAPQAGGLFAGLVAAITGSLLWLALPLRPRLRPARLDLVLAPLALLTAALVAPFVLGEIELQHAMADEHAELAHNFDMAWVCLALTASTAAAALSAAARRLAVVGGLSLAWIGLTRWLVTDETTWSLVAVLLGAASALAGARRSAA